jgi:ABC-type antimicrobial peptide transport system ATPase subunit
VETGSTASVFADPQAEATRALLDARPGTTLRQLAGVA